MTGRPLPPPAMEGGGESLIGWLVLANAAVLVVVQTVLTAPEVAAALRFDPGSPLARPWAALTYPFVHQGWVHLAATSALLALAGPAVAREMGAQWLGVYYLACAAGAALFAVLLAGLGTVAPMAGALAPALGLALARGWLADDIEVALDPLPLRVQVRSLVAWLAVVTIIAGLAVNSPALSLAHAGGAMAGYLALRLRAVARRPPSRPPAMLPTRRPVMTPVRQEADDPAPRSAAPGAPVFPPEAGAPQASVPPGAPSGETGAADRVASGELDRLLDKISAQGLDSLTTLERRILAEYAERKRRERENR